LVADIVPRKGGEGRKKGEGLVRRISPWGVGAVLYVTFARNGGREKKKGGGRISTTLKRRKKKKKDTLSEPTASSVSIKVKGRRGEKG